MNEPYHNLTRANNNQLTGLIYKKVTNSLPGSNIKVIWKDDDGDGDGDDGDDDGDGDDGDCDGDGDQTKIKIKKFQGQMRRSLAGWKRIQVPLSGG